MNKIIIPVIAGILALSIGLAQDVYGPLTPPILDDRSYENVKAIPSWIDNNFKWYGEGKIAQADLLNSLNFMLDNGIMHLSDKAAQEVKSLREENKQLHEKIVQYKESDLDFVTRSMDTPSTGQAVNALDEQSSQQALHYLRKAYDLNPTLQTKIVQFDKDHDKWIDVLSIDWGGIHTEGDPDRPIIIGRIYSQGQTGDMVLKGSKIKENYVDTAKLALKTDYGTILNAIDTEYKLVSSKVKLMTEISDRVSEITDKDMANLDSIKKELASIQTKLDVLKLQTTEMQEMNQSFNLQYLQLQQKMQDENRQFTMLSNVMKTKHDTAKNSISNIR